MQDCAEASEGISVSPTNPSLAPAAANPGRRNLLNPGLVTTH
jgi:hypothetical protein